MDYTTDQPTRHFTLWCTSCTKYWTRPAFSWEIYTPEEICSSCIHDRNISGTIKAWVIEKNSAKPFTDIQEAINYLTRKEC